MERNRSAQEGTVSAAQRQGGSKDDSEAGSAEIKQGLIQCVV